MLLRFVADDSGRPSLITHAEAEWTDGEAAEGSPCQSGGVVKYLRGRSWRCCVQRLRYNARRASWTTSRSPPKSTSHDLPPLFRRCSGQWGNVLHDRDCWP